MRTYSIFLTIQQSCSEKFSLLLSYFNKVTPVKGDTTLTVLNKIVTINQFRSSHLFGFYRATKTLSWIVFNHQAKRVISHLLLLCIRRNRKRTATSSYVFYAQLQTGRGFKNICSIWIFTFFFPFSVLFLRSKQQQINPTKSHNLTMFS